MACKFNKKCQFYSLNCFACRFGGSNYCGAYKNLEYGRVKAIVEKEKGVILGPIKACRELTFPEKGNFGAEG